MTIKVIPFKMEHLERIELRKEELDGMLGLENGKEYLELMVDHCTETGTLLYRKGVVCCAGFTIVWPGVAECWIIPSPHIHSCKKSFSEFFRDYVNKIFSKHNLHRLQTSASEDRLHDRWLTWLGFQKEGTMRQYTHSKKNRCIYARIR